jgi:hypothetical protein
MKSSQVTLEIINLVIRAEFIPMVEVKKSKLYLVISHYEYLSKKVMAQTARRAEIGDLKLPDGFYYLPNKLSSLKEITNHKY